MIYRNPNTGVTADLSVCPARGWTPTTAAAPADNKPAEMKKPAPKRATKKAAKEA